MHELLRKGIELVKQIKTNRQTGQNLRLSWKREAKTYKTANVIVEKQTLAVIRLGVNYENMSVNAERETGPLPWGQWVKGYEHFLIEHKGMYYLAITTAGGALKQGTEKPARIKCMVKWFLNGIPTDKETVTPYLLASELNENKGVRFTIKLGSLMT